MCPALEVEVELTGQRRLGQFLNHPVQESFEALLQALAWPGVGALDNVDYLFIFCVTQRTAVVLLVATSGQYSSNCTLACKVFQEPTLFAHWEHLEGRSCCVPGHLVSKMERDLVTGNPVINQLVPPYHLIQGVGLD